MRRVSTWVGASVVALASAGCSSSGGASPSGSSRLVDCQPLTTVRTFDGDDAVTNALKVSVAPNVAITNVVMPARTAVRAATSGAAAGDDIWAMVGNHFGTTVARGGQRIGTGDAAYIGALTNRGSDDRTYVIYQSVVKYTGRFTVECSGRRTSGRYVTYGMTRLGMYACSTSATSDLETILSRQCE